MGFVRAASQQPASWKKARRWIALCIAAGVLAFASCAVATTLYVEFRLTAPARAAVGRAPADLHAETVVIPSTSGAILSGWFVPGRPNGGAVVLLHGIRSNRLSMIRRARLLKEQGYSVLLFDFQSHGESTGERITFGALEALDARSAVEFVRRRLPEERVGAIGTSLGGAAAVLGPSSLPVDALVLEAMYPDIQSALTNRLRAALGEVASAVAVPLLVPLFESLARVAGVHQDQLRPIDRIGEITAPVLIASGARDNRTTVAETRGLFARAREPKSLWIVPAAGHVDLEAFSPDEYRRHVLPFLDRLRRADSRDPRASRSGLR
jgi:fermentation-respiration switch protein FrsA (DUF1100 family)